jgi:hypothetical protein
MTSRFDAARVAFLTLVATLQSDAELCADVQSSFDRLLSRYNTQIYENRFIVGGVAERIIAATFVAMGKAALTMGVRVTRTDIAIGDVCISVKGAFRPGKSDLRLVNVMGDSPAAVWNEATIFVVSQKGIGYADPMLLPDATKRAKDAVLLKRRALYAMWESKPEYFMEMKLPYSREDESQSDVASRIVADELLRYTKRLRPFDKRLPSE